jgi:membrane-associated phospholipid phosphatase
MTRSPRQLLIAAAACAVAFVVLLAVVYASWRVRELDATAMDGFLDVQTPWMTAFFERVSQLGDPEAVGLLGLALAAVALARGKPRYAAAVIFLVVATSVSSQVLKAVIDFPRYEAALSSLAVVKPSAFPSGHATAAMTLALCGILVAPQRVRPLAAFAGAALALAVSFSVVSLGGHFPSDLAGGFLLATGWTLVVLAALQAASRRWPERTVRAGARAAAARAADRLAEAGLVAAGATAAVVGILAVGALVFFRLPELMGLASGRTTFVFAAAGLAAGAAILLGGVTAALLRHR